MHLTFLGTGPSMPIPRIYCSCPTCKDARHPKSRSARLRSSALLTTGKKHILFDTTPDVLKQLEVAKTFCVDAVFITHAHYDAIGGFYDLNNLLFIQKHKARLYVEQGTWRQLKNDLGKTKPWLKAEIIKPFHPFKLFHLSITPFRVYHSATPGFPTLGFRVGNKLVYASDIKKIPKESERFIRNIPYAVLDGCMWFGRQIPTHLNIEESIRIADQLKVRHLFLTQISHCYPLYKIAGGEIQKYCRKNKIRTKVRLAHDGMELIV